MDRVCRSATCETRAIVDLEDELFALRYQWSEMLGNSAIENFPDVLGACVTDSKRLYDKMQHTVITPKGKESGHRMPDSEETFGDFLNPVFWGTKWSTTG